MFIPIPIPIMPALARHPTPFMTISMIFWCVLGWDAVYVSSIHYHLRWLKLSLDVQSFPISKLTPSSTDSLTKEFILPKGGSVTFYMHNILKSSKGYV